jgi:crossover junction endodeoxyribonuclease RusA
MIISFTVLGTPQSQGSVKAFIPKGWKRPVLTSDNPNLKSWRQGAASVAFAAMKQHGFPVSMAAVEIDATFYFAKPKSTSKRILHKITKPDCDKLVRALLDALTGVVYADDSQVIGIVCRKRFGLPERVEVGIMALPVKVRRLRDLTKLLAAGD